MCGSVKWLLVSKVGGPEFEAGPWSPVRLKLPPCTALHPFPMSLE